MIWTLVTLLYYAISLGHTAVAFKLMEHNNIDVDEPCGKEGSPLQLAANRGFTDIARALVKRNANVHGDRGIHGSALHAAVIRGNFGIVEMLLDAGADVDNFEGLYGNALQAASYLSPMQVFKCLLDAEPNVNAQGGIFGSALQAACAAGHYKYVERLLGKGADMKQTGGLLGSPFQAAFNGEHHEIVRELDSRGISHESQAGSLWRRAWNNDRYYGPARKAFQRNMIAGQDIPPELSSDQQQLAAVIKRSTVLDQLNTSGWIPFKIYKRAMDSKSSFINANPGNITTERENHVYSRIFTAGLSELALLLTSGGPFPEVRARTISFSQLIGNRATQYESIALEEDDQLHVRLQNMVVRLCVKLFRAEMEFGGPRYRWLRPSCLSSTSGWEAGLDAATGMEEIWELDAHCQRQLAINRNVQMSAAGRRSVQAQSNLTEMLAIAIIEQGKSIQRTLEIRQLQPGTPQAIVSELAATLQNPPLQAPKSPEIVESIDMSEKDD